MTTRRDFLKTAMAASLVSARGFAVESPLRAHTSADPRGTEERRYWRNVALRLGTPVLSALAEGRLKATMPVEAKIPVERARYTYLEALGRLLAGLAPWLELGPDRTEEGEERRRLGELARRSIESATDPRSSDFVDFSLPGQTLVDAAFLGQALLRAPTELWEKLAPETKANVIHSLIETRRTKPPENNWVLFASMVEAALLQLGATADGDRLRHGLAQHQRWYLGDGMYGDGPDFHWDYYNAYVIQPMLLEVVEVAAAHDGQWRAFESTIRSRLTRFAAIQERLVAPDGTYPVIGRSSSYRCGAFQGLALAALRRLLPANMAPSQARVALGAVIRRTLQPPGTFDAKGWLQIGVSGHQPSLGESYISTGSLYLCSVALLPLGLPAEDPFWSAPDSPTTSQQIWSGVDVPADHALTSPPPTASR